MRVAFIVPYLSTPSGWRTASVGAIRALNHYCDVAPLVVVSRADAPMAHHLLPEYQLVELPEVQSMAFSMPRSWPKLGAAWWQARSISVPPVDLVHSLDAYPTGLVGHWLAKRLSVPHVITALGTYAVKWYTSPGDRQMYEKVLRQSACICPMSEGTARLMEHYFNGVLSTTPRQVVLLGSDYPQQLPRQKAWLRSPRPQPTLLSVGAVKPRKGHHISLAAFARVKAQLPDACYWIVGSTSNQTYYKQLQQFIADHQLQDVEFLGEVSEDRLQQCYEQASVFLLTSQQQGLYFEGFGWVYLEAGAYGLPTVGTRTGGIPDAIKDGITGYLAEPDDVEGIARAVIRLLTDSKLAQQMGQANREWAEMLTWERYAEEQKQVYKKVMIN